MKSFTLQLLATAGAIAYMNHAVADESLLQRKKCFACHHMEKKIVGPSFSSIAARYSSIDTLLLASKVLNGAGTSNGPRCPPHATYVSPEEANRLATFIISLNSATPAKATRRPPENSIGRGTFEM